MRKATTIAVAVAAALGGAAVEAASISVNLIGVTSKSSNGASIGNIGASTATWSYDTVSGAVTGSGVMDAQFFVGLNPIFAANIDDLSVGSGAAAAATSYTCVEGIFGGFVGANICGNYGFGGNFADDSIVSYGPGTAFSRTLLGDDVPFGPQQNLADFDGMTATLSGTTLTLENGTATSGYAMTFSTVPVPAAAWLFGSALGLLGWARRRSA